MPDFIIRDGRPGKSAYQLAIDSGAIPPETTLAQWLADHLKGDPGDDGAVGPVGPKGDPGNDGVDYIPPAWIADGNPIVTATHVFTTGTVDGDWTIHRHDRTTGTKTIASEENNSGITTLAAAKQSIETLNYTAF